MSVTFVSVSVSHFLSISDLSSNKEETKTETDRLRESEWVREREIFVNNGLRIPYSFIVVLKDGLRSIDKRDLLNRDKVWCIYFGLYPKFFLKMKRSFFQAAVASILLYGCSTWTLTKWLEKKLDSNYTRMLRAVLNKSWRQHPTRHQLYDHLPLITKTIQVRRTRYAGHCWRNRDELIRDVLLWTPTHGRAKAGRPVRTYIQQLCEDTRCCPEDLPEAMKDREKWRERVRDIRATSTTWWWWWYPKLSWPMQVYEVSIIKGETMAWLISKYMKKWLGVPNSLANVALYSSSTKLKLPMLSLVEVFKFGKTRLFQILRDTTSYSWRTPSLPK